MKPPLRGHLGRSRGYPLNRGFTVREILPHNVALGKVELVNGAQADEKCLRITSQPYHSPSFAFCDGPRMRSNQDFENVGLQLLFFFWACLQFKNFRESKIKTGNCYHGVAKCSYGKFSSGVSTQISEQCPPIMQFWSKVMTSEAEQRPTLVTASYGRHRRQRVKALHLYVWTILDSTPVIPDFSSVKSVLLSSTSIVLNSSSNIIFFRFDIYTVVSFAVARAGVTQRNPWTGN